MLFDPHKTRWSLSDEGGGLQYIASRAPEVDDPIGKLAYHDLGTIIFAWLVGLHNDVHALIPRVINWLDRAIENGERFGEDDDYHRLRLLWARSLSLWMISGNRCESDWAEARTLESSEWKSLSRPWPVREVVSVGLNDYMAFSVQAGEYADGLQEFERWVGAKKISLAKVLTPREFAYAMCLHRLRGEYDHQSLFAAGRRMLQANLEERWLGAGQAIRAGTWLKIVYWDLNLAHNRPLNFTPRQAILQAYENMPKVPYPDFLRV